MSAGKRLISMSLCPAEGLFFMIDYELIANDLCKYLDLFNVPAFKCQFYNPPPGVSHTGISSNLSIYLTKFSLFIKNNVTCN